MSELKDQATEICKFRITFRSDIFVDAASEEEARDKFGSMAMAEIGQISNFVEIVSCEKE